MDNEETFNKGSRRLRIRVEQSGDIEDYIKFKDHIGIIWKTQDGVLFDDFGHVFKEK